MDSNNTQSTTRNPQENVSGGLQPNSPELQPLENENSSNLNPNQLPKTDNLKVAEQNGAAGTIQVESSPGGVGPFSSGTSLWVFSGASLILALILLAMVRVASKPGKTAKTSFNDNQQDSAKSAVNKDKVIAAKSVISKSKKTKVKSKAKKNTKKKKKK